MLENNLSELCDLLNANDSCSRASQLKLVYKIYNSGPEGALKLLTLLTQRYADEKIVVNFIDGSIYQLLLNSNYLNILSVINNNFKSGIVSVKSDLDINYCQLQQLLIAKKFQEADQLTQAILCQLSQLIGKHTRAWLYFTDILALPNTDLNTIDQLWQVYSNGLFGLSVQRKIWLANNNNWEKFWNKIGWTSNNITCRYPQEFTWDITAPAGHLPLFNQLRGMQVLSALFTHPVWIEPIN
jgi:hypothetical protein